MPAPTVKECDAATKAAAHAMATKPRVRKRCSLVVSVVFILTSVGLLGAVTVPLSVVGRTPGMP